jgi:hypothetical protein
MAHWGWYWKVKKQHKPRKSCTSFWLNEIDSFQMFKSKEAFQYMREHINKSFFEIPRYQLTMAMQKNECLRVQFSGGVYTIPIEKKSCNYGGFYRFFHCPACKRRMRKLYCMEGVYLCRKCANLAYYSQRLRPSERYASMSYKIADHLQNRGGSLEKKPPWMKRHTFQKLRIKYVKYDEKRSYAIDNELLQWRGAKVLPWLSFYEPPCGMYDAHVERKEVQKYVNRTLTALTSSAR